MQANSTNSNPNEGKIGTQVGEMNVAGSVTNTYYLGSNPILDAGAHKIDTSLREKVISNITMLAHEHASQEQAAWNTMSDQPAEVDEACQSILNTNAFDAWISSSSHYVLPYITSRNMKAPANLHFAEQLAVSLAYRLRSIDSLTNQIWYTRCSVFENKPDVAFSTDSRIEVAHAIRNILARLVTLSGLQGELCQRWLQDTSFLAVFGDDFPLLEQTMRWFSTLAASTQQSMTLVLSFDSRPGTLIDFPWSLFSTLRNAAPEIPNLKFLLVGSLVLEGGEPKNHGTMVSQYTEIDECLASLSFNEIDFYLERIPRAWPGTNQWLWSHSTLQAWRQGPSSILWIQGKPGSGKSVLSRTIIERGRALEEPDMHKKTFKSDKIWISAHRWVYSRRFEALYTDHIFMLRSMLYQLLSYEHHTFKNLQKLWRQVRQDLRQREYQFQELKEMLRMVVSRLQHVRLFVIDGFDEGIISSPASSKSRDIGREHVMAFLLELLEESQHLKFIILSRPEPDIELVLGEHPQCYTIVLQHENDKDIRLMTDAQLSILDHNLQHGIKRQQNTNGKIHQNSTTQSKKVVNLIRKGRIHLGSSASEPRNKDSTLHRIRDYIAFNAQGVFLWVTLIFKELGHLATQGLVSWNDIEAVIKGLPTDLLEVYKDIVKELEGRHSHAGIIKAQKALEWVYIASKMHGPFSLQVFRDALSIPPMDRGYSSKPEQDPFLDFQSVEEHWLGYRRSLYSLCGPFIDVVRPKEEDPESYGPFDLVQLIHTTARDFLASSAAGHLQYSMNKAPDNVRNDMISYVKLSLPSWDNKYCPLPAKPGSHWETNINEMIEYLDSKPLLAFALTNLPQAQTHLPEWATALGQAAIPTKSLEKLYPKSKAFQQTLNLRRYTLMFYTDGFPLDELASQELASQELEGPSKSMKNQMFAAALGKMFCDSCGHGCITAIENLIALVALRNKRDNEVITEVISTGVLIAAVCQKDFPNVARLTGNTRYGSLLLNPYANPSLPIPPTRRDSSQRSSDSPYSQIPFPNASFLQLAIYHSNNTVYNLLLERVLKTMKEVIGPDYSAETRTLLSDTTDAQDPLENLIILPHSNHVEPKMYDACISTVFSRFFGVHRHRWKRLLMVVKCIVLLRLSWYDFAARNNVQSVLSNR